MSTRNVSRRSSVARAVVPAACGLREVVVGRVGGVRVAVPADRVETVLDGSIRGTAVCDEPWVSGWFMHRDRLWLAVRLDGPRPRRGSEAKRIVIRETDHVRFAIEVDEMLGTSVMDDVSPEALGARGLPVPGGWLLDSRGRDGLPICCVDVDAIASRLAGR